MVQQRLGQYLSAEQKQLLRHVAKVREELHADAPPEPVTGLEGILAAHKWLVKNRSKGLLVGALAEKIWGSKKSPNSLEDSKDVDVLIFPGCPAPKEKFECGIDWWIPQTDRVYYFIGSNDLSKSSSVHSFYKNGNDIILYFSFPEFPDTRSNYGLYLPSKDLLVALRVAEAYSLAGQGMDADIEVKFASQFKPKQKSLHPDVAKNLAPLMTVNLTEDLEGKIHERVYPTQPIAAEILIKTDDPYARLSNISLESIHPRAVDAFGCPDHQRNLFEKLEQFAELNLLGKPAPKAKIDPTWPDLLEPNWKPETDWKGDSAIFYSNGDAEEKRQNSQDISDPFMAYWKYVEQRVELGLREDETFYLERTVPVQTRWDFLTHYPSEPFAYHSNRPISKEDAQAIFREYNCTPGATGVCFFPPHGAPFGRHRQPAPKPIQHTRP